MNRNESMTAPCGLNCGGFPCGMLKEWATKSDKYEKALENLRRMARQ